MKKSKLFMALGAFTLVVAGIMATKANKKFTISGAIYTATGHAQVLTGPSCFAISGIPTADLTFNSLAGPTLTVFNIKLAGFTTSGNTFHTIYY